MLSELPGGCDFSEVPDVDEPFSLLVDFIPSEVPDVDESLPLVEDFSVAPEEDESLPLVEDFSVPLDEDEPLVVPGVLKSPVPLGEGESVALGVLKSPAPPGVGELSVPGAPLGDSVVVELPDVLPGSAEFSPLEQAPRSNTNPNTIEKAVNCRFTIKPPKIFKIFGTES